MLELLRQQLPVVRELPVDAARRQPHAFGGKDDLILVNADVDGVAGARNPRQLLQRTAWDDRFEFRNRAVELGLLDREPVRIGRGHHELAARERDENPCEDGP